MRNSADIMEKALAMVRWAAPSPLSRSRGR
jgi:hypothetical protein